MPETALFSNQGPSGYRQTMTLLDKALKRRWPISKELKAAIMDKAQEYLTDQTISAKEQAAWAKLVVMAEAQNQSDSARKEEYKRLDQGKLTANQGHTLILDGPIRPQVACKQVTGILPSDSSASPDGPIRPQIPSKVIPSPALNENAAEGQPGGVVPNLAGEPQPLLPPLKDTPHD